MRFLLLLLACIGLPLQAAELPDTVAKALRAADIPQQAVAVYVQRVDKPQPLIAVNARQPMNPASTMKLLTSYAALELLGPAYAWKTETYADGAIKDGVLNGNLVIKGYGDPALTLPGFWNVLRELRKTGLREIRGNLILDRSYFDAGTQGQAVFDNEPWRAYNAAPDALAVNFKATEFRLQPDEGAHSVVVTADPDLPQLKIVNRLALQSGNCGNWKDGFSYQVTQEAGQAVVTLSGTYVAACGVRSFNLAVVDDVHYVGELFGQLWREQGGAWSGEVKAGLVQAQAILLTSTLSPPLEDAVRLMNKNSNNLMARHLLLTLAAEKGGAPGTAEKGAEAVRAWLTSKQLDFPELEIENGAGLSRIERLSAEHMGRLLMDAWKSPVMPELMSSLPIAAVDGTMEKRLKDTPVSGMAHLKTGSLEGVKTLAGYLLDRNGHRWVVVFMVNHSKAAYSRNAQDALLQWLAGRDEARCCDR
ncbi:D-alanyl-D-alanine carboxypeptidase / D-alanyl-D-alanine-endopeptidase [Novimethylophilus kurashikiensis]|uniref:D-alanyl-D-alanine carboxypeptidase / D-alanyl-D-alanine-endopeptidase n=1 Tax=Novimethylophilus kurashikiensis TaxID=1825523 RepID=A0A2R5FD95_9PROT|nr:D-alanyl-D-alanine carboxypeptidase/D-alanyl-D-alanine-endopeptidase [Novimethylophilus kurashikiensis]GBG15498.1 D-alanyl-D-alanine carboxypeptidase / D-alanyl-D-alanine-endopeptidase [Novimethylophilus kurashikiensis]